MPELPEIETVKLQLLKELPGLKVTAVEVLSPKIFKGDKNLLIGKKIQNIIRKAKVLIFDLEDNVAMAFHFKMTGQLILGGHPDLHTRVIFKLNKGTLYFNDQRLFGWVIVGSKSEIYNLPFLKNLGPEPFEIGKDKFIAIFSKPQKAIKLAIMDQKLLSGVGNIYANDALWEAGIHPNTGCASLSTEQLGKLYEAIIKVLKEGIKYGGATAADAKYTDLHGLGGHYQDHFRVYDREGLPCLKCKTKIAKFVIGGRGTYWCPYCQK